MAASAFESLAVCVCVCVCVVQHGAVAAERESPTSYTLTDSKLSATLGGPAGAAFGQLTELKMAGGDNVLDLGGSAGAGSIWSASFVGAGIGAKTISSTDSTCASTQVVGDATTTSVTFQWNNCVVPGAAAPAPPAPPGPLPWVQHAASNCAGQCLARNSNGPMGGHCDRMPGCGHDAGLPFCKVGDMEARCANATGCVCFNTNGYLYSGSNAVTPFEEYPLEAWTRGGSPGPNTGVVNITLAVTLADGLLAFDISFVSNGTTSLWDYGVSLGGIKKTGATQGLSSTSARQMLGLWDSAAAGSGGSPAIYFAAHDPAHIVKTCSVSVPSSSSTASLSCSMLAKDGTLPLHEYASEWPVVVSILPVGSDWWDITQVYRSWALPNAHWTAFGPLETRTDLPDWLENITLWVNNNWGGDPLRPNYGGDPEYVKNEMLKVNAKLDLPSHGGHLALHWYEWDTLGYALGSNHTKCEPTVGPPCGFDTHYPDYFPARVGCTDAIKAMQQAGMRVIPYINGQLYDTRIPRWKSDNASASVQKFTTPTMASPGNIPALTPHLEHFDGITSAVMCPATRYWHGVMRDAMLKIVNDIGFDGVYVDQVGNGEQRNCGDPTHNHTVNGGSFWAEAFYSILKEVRAATPPSMFMTEGIVEEVSGTGFDILLGIDYGGWGELPIWHSIYGGYGYATGHATTGAPLASGLLLELTAQFMAGATMGWFTYQDQGGAFFDPANAARVAFIQKLSLSRIVAKDWMVHGRVTRSMNLQDASGTLHGGCFLRDTAGEIPSVVCAVAAPTLHPGDTGTPYMYTFSMVAARYGLTAPAGSKIAATDMLTGKPLGNFDPANVTITGTLGAFDVKLVKLAVEAAQF